MDAESIAALAMCGMVGEAALPSIKTPIGDIRINEDVDVRYNSDGGFYRARVSAIEEDAIRVTYPEDQVGTAMSRRGAETRHCSLGSPMAARYTTALSLPSSTVSDRPPCLCHRPGTSRRRRFRSQT